MDSSDEWDGCPHGVAEGWCYTCRPSRPSPPRTLPDAQAKDAAAALQAFWAASSSSLENSEPFCVIDADEFEEARRDPGVRAMWTAARRYRDALVAHGHCPCHLVVNCPDRPST